MEVVFPAGYYGQEAVPSLAALLGNLNDLLERCSAPQCWTTLR